MRIYTRTGDEGTTGLLGGDRVSKHSARIQAIGDVDELNAAIGLCRLHAEGSTLAPTLTVIQNWLFDLGAELAAAAGGKFTIESVTDAQIDHLETAMDRQTEALPPLKAFVLPGGCPLSAHLHFARCVCRRAERSVLILHEESEIRSTTRRFLNRLSDYLFVSARTANQEAGLSDVEWTKNAQE